MAKKILCYLLSCVILVGASYGGITVFAAEKDEDESIEMSFAEKVENAMNSEVALKSIEESNDVGKLIEDNFSAFVNEYNKVTEDKLSATSIEYSKSVYIIEDETYGVYLDFDEKNGYAVITNKNIIYELTAEGDLTELRELDKLIYSVIDGFVFFDENNICQRVYAEQTEGYSYSPYEYSPLTNASAPVYPGQKEAGDGQIDSDLIDEYVKERYPGYTLLEKKEDLCNTFDYSLQVMTSYYIMYPCDKDGNNLEGDDYFTEANCVLNSIFNLLRNWEKNSKISGIKYESTTDVGKNITEDPLYSQYGQYIVVSKNNPASAESVLSSKDPIKTEYYYWCPNFYFRLSTMPTLYANIRAYAISEYGYTPESYFYTKNIPDTFQHVAQNSYKVSLSVSRTSSASMAMDSVDRGVAAYMAIYNSVTYGNHGVSMIGYRTYVSYFPFFGTSFAREINFYQIADGWNSTAKYFDPNAKSETSIEFCLLEG